MSRHVSGLLVSQLIGCFEAPLAGEQVWALCYEICKTLVDTSNKDTEDGNANLSCTRVVFELDTIYLRKEGSVAFVLDGNPGELEREHEPTPLKQMNSFGNFLHACLDHSASKFSKRQIEDELKTLIRHMVQGKLKDTHGHWVHVVSDRCVHHASSKSVIPSEYYRGLCKALINEAVEMNNFLEILNNEFIKLRSYDALCTLQLLQARPTVRCWLQVMSELRQDVARRREAVASPSFPITWHPLSVVSMKDTCSQQYSQGLPEIQNPPRQKLVRQTPTKIPEQLDLGEKIEVGKPSLSSTPSAPCKPIRKVLRPPQRLVDQVTSWMLETDDWITDDTPGFCTTTRVHEPGTSYEREWTELDSQGLENDLSWSSGRQQSSLSLSEEWFKEIMQIRGVLTELQLDTVMDKETLFEGLQTGKICFCCRRTKLSVFSRGVICEICNRKVCSLCTIQAKSREMGITGHNQLGTYPKEGVLKHIHRVLTTQRNIKEKDIKVCKDCRDFLQRFYK